MDSQFISHHSVIILSICCDDFTGSHVVEFFMKTIESSAYMIVPVLGLSIVLNSYRSFAYNVKRVEPCIDPCGTPIFIYMERVLLEATNISQLGTIQ